MFSDRAIAIYFGLDATVNARLDEAFAALIAGDVGAARDIVESY